MKRSFPTKRSISFLPIRRWVVIMEISSLCSWILRSGRATVPSSMSMIHPRNSLTHIQSSSPVRTFLALNKSLASPRSEGAAIWEHTLFCQRLGVVAWAHPEPRRLQHPYNSQYGWGSCMCGEGPSPWTAGRRWPHSQNGYVCVN